MKTNLVKLSGTFLGILLLCLVPYQYAAATDHAITGGTYGPTCNSGGYFTPSTLTINSGDTVTISVPSDDPYAGGMEVHFSNGLDYIIGRGGSQTTAALTASVTYYGTWPSSGCMKGSGSITVDQPAPPPSGSGSSGSTSSSSSSSSSSSTTTTKPSTQATTTPSPSTTPTPAPQAATPTSSSSPAPGHDTGLSAATTTGPAPQISNQSPSFKTIAIYGSTSAALVVALVLGIWRFFIRP